MTRIACGAYLSKTPFAPLSNGPRTGDASFFRFERDHLSTTFEVGDVGSFRELLREILDWRLAQYLNQQSSRNATADIVCRVALNGDLPFLLLPNAATTLHLEQGPAPVRINEESFEILIEKITINVVQVPGEDMNLLPQILRRWFGDEVDLPGRSERVRLKRGPSGFEMEALRISASQELRVWERYPRDTIAPAFGSLSARQSGTQASLSRTRRFSFWLP